MVSADTTVFDDLYAREQQTLLTIQTPPHVYLRHQATAPQMEYSLAPRQRDQRSEDHVGEHQGCYFRAADHGVLSLWCEIRKCVHRGTSLAKLTSWIIFPM